VAQLLEAAMRKVSVLTIAAEVNMRAATRQLALRLLEANVVIHFVTHFNQPDREDEIFLGSDLSLKLEFQHAYPAVQCRLMTSAPSHLFRRWFVSPSGAGMTRVVATVKQHCAKKPQPAAAAA
jgi:hypothetical protein